MKICKFHQEVECRAAAKVLEAPSNWSKNLKFHSNLCYLFKRYIKYTHKNRYVHKIIRQFHINITMCICPPLVNKYSSTRDPHIFKDSHELCELCELWSNKLHRPVNSETADEIHRTHRYLNLNFKHLAKMMLLCVFLPSFCLSTTSLSGS